MSFNSLGDVVVVGIPDTGSNKGEIKAYRWNGSAWNQAVPNTIEGPTNNGYFGRAVDINGAGDIIIVGGKDVGKYGTKRGLVRTYRLTKNYRNDGKWEQFGRAICMTGTNYYYTGSSVAIDKVGNTIAVASYEEHAGGYTDNGAVRIYEIDSNSQWIVPQLFMATEVTEVLVGTHKVYHSIMMVLFWLSEHIMVAQILVITQER